MISAPDLARQLKATRNGDGWTDLDGGSADDRAWFERHVGRNHRIRKRIGGERLLDGPRHGFKPMVVAKQIEPGTRLRVGFYWRRGEPLLNSEAVAERLFQLAVEGKRVVIVGRGAPS
jgi:hypothetical protein